MTGHTPSGSGQAAYKPYKRDMPYSYLAGSFPAQEWLQAGRPAEALLVTGQQDQAIIDLAAQAQVPIIEAPRVIHRLADEGGCQVISSSPRIICNSLPR